MAAAVRLVSAAGRARFARSPCLLSAPAARARLPLACTVARPGCSRRYFCDNKDKRSSELDGLDQQELLANSYSASWFEPESLWDYAQNEDDNAETTSESFDAAFAKDMGSRNAAWRKDILKKDDQYFNRMGKGQAPKYLWIGCSDSRVAAELMVESEPGEMFVHRNIANMVVSTDTNLRAVLHYALEYLKIEHIVVCGHYDCGGCKAAFTNHDHNAPVESWLTNIRDVYRLHQEELEAIIDDEERHKRFVEINTVEQCLNLFKTGDVQRRRVATAADSEDGVARPRIHAMVFSPSDGILRRLPIDFKYYMKKYKNVYNMYDKGSELA